MFVDFNQPSLPVGFLRDNDEFGFDIVSVPQRFDVDGNTGDNSVDPQDTQRLFECGNILTVALYRFGA